MLTARARPEARGTMEQWAREMELELGLMLDRIEMGQAPDRRKREEKRARAETRTL